MYGVIVNSRYISCELLRGGSNISNACTSYFCKVRSNNFLPFITSEAATGTHDKYHNNKYEHYYQ